MDAPECLACSFADLKSEREWERGTIYDDSKSRTVPFPVLVPSLGLHAVLFVMCAIILDDGAFRYLLIQPTRRESQWRRSPRP